MESDEVEEDLALRAAAIIVAARAIPSVRASRTYPLRGFFWPRRKAIQFAPLTTTAEGL